MSPHVPLQVRAILAAGIAHTAPWGIALDGLLAAELWHQLKTHRTDPTPALDQDNPPDLDLPLARCTPGHGPWHWAATTAYPESMPDRTDIHTWTGRADHRALEHLAPTLPKVVSDRQGRYRARCMPLPVTPCRHLLWHAIGDPAAIQTLLSPIRAIGKKRAHGEGHVLHWDVTPRPDLDPFTAAHLHPNGHLARPTPSSCLSDRTVIDGGTGRAGIRPPYIHHSRQHTLHLPSPVIPT